jgi:acetyl esterase/lipase
MKAMLRGGLWLFLLAAGSWAQQPAAIPPDRADLSYGPYAGNKLDFWQAKSEKPAPLIVFIHGGGFVNGDKKQVNPRYVKACLDAGVSFASINYRFRTEVPIQAVLRDSARAIQHLRAHAADFGIDKARVAAFGGSAGAGTSLWLAFHDDLADPKNPDPVLRESTRLAAAGSVAGQATYDLLRWAEVLGSQDVLKFTSDAEVTSFYGAKNRAQLESAEYAKIRADVDMLGLITKDDPPVFLSASDHWTDCGIGTR